MTLPRVIATAFCAVTVCVIMWLSSTSAAVLSLPLPKDGMLCHWGVFLGGPIGMVLPTSGAPDTPGPNGNEIDQVYRIFGLSRNTSRGEKTFFIGWLLRSRAHEYNFVPKGVNGALFVKFGRSFHGSVNAWLDTMKKREPRAFAGDLAAIAARHLTNVAFAPCFKDPKASRR